MKTLFTLNLSGNYVQPTSYYLRDLNELFDIIKKCRGGIYNHAHILKYEVENECDICTSEHIVDDIEFNF